ncbi:protein tyrosine phosphatase receptor type C-associated protein [Oxyura jamaicensis]|uniref:protein tyrosine phosphatase receptor type C-associated protein n=1 Tax=Oxyura jamaicensis TaxID=8884 RepID=UPI0015A56FA7|nr:protein tyrosine phosphatase receptor type C-associated protein [Oxyura jamaicensis]
MHHPGFPGPFPFRVGRGGMGTAPASPRIDTSAAGGGETGSTGGPPQHRLRLRHQDLLQQHPAMAGARCPPAPPLLLVLAGLAAAGEPVGSRNDRLVGALLGLLLCLAVGLALAWHHLCRLSDGRYHPRPMGRQALALLRGRWHQLQGREGLAEPPGDGNEDAAPPAEEEELMPWAQQQRRQEDEEVEDEEEEEEQKEQEDEEDDDEEEEEAAAPLEAEQSPPGVPQALGGSAEALLSDMHAFSGTAAWGDTRPHVTAL